MLLAIDFTNLHEILQALYQDMMPLCEKPDRGSQRELPGWVLLFYVAAKVWQAIARAEPIDVYPLLRPFAIGLCILFFPHLRHRHDQHGTLARGEGLPRDARITDLRHEPVPGAEGRLWRERRSGVTRRRRIWQAGKTLTRSSTNWAGHRRT